MRTTHSDAILPHSATAVECGGGRIATGLIVLAVAGVPLIIAPGFSLEYEVLPKLLVLLSATAGLLFCWRTWYPGAAALLASTHGKLLTAALGALLAAAAISTLLSARSELALSGSPARRHGLVTQAAIAVFAFLTASCLNGQPRRQRLVLTAIAAVSGLIAIYAIAQYGGWDPFLSAKLYTTYYNGNLVRIPGTLGHAVHLACFLASALLLTYGLAMENKGVRRVLLFLDVVLMLVAILLSGTRSAVLALVAAGVFTAVSLRRFRIRLAAKWLVGGALLTLILAGFVQLEIGTSLRLRLEEWRDDAYGGPRLGVWRDSLALTVLHPMFGSGPETFGIEFRRRESQQLSQAYPDFFQESPHNVLLATAIEQGLCGLFALLSLAWIFFSPSAREEGCGSSIRAAGVCTFLCLLFIPLTIPEALMLYTAAALLTSSRIAPAIRPPVNPGAPLRVISSVLAVLFVLAAAAYWRQDAGYLRVARASQAGAAGEMVQAFDSIAGMSFPGAGDDLWCSRQFAAVARSSSGAVAAQAWKSAAAASARAERAGDNVAEAAFQSAILALAGNNAPKGELKLRQSIDAAPNWYKPHLLLAQLLKFTGRREQWDAEAERALVLAGGLRSDVERALQAGN